MASKKIIASAAAAAALWWSCAAQGEILFPAVIGGITADSAADQAGASDPRFPGRMIGRSGKAEQALFRQSWKYREITYESHFGSSVALASEIYSLAIHTGDITPDTPKDLFLRGVQGCHYSISQVLEWANDGRAAKSEEELGFIKRLEEDKVIAKDRGVYVAAGKVSHVLSAAAGKKRTFELNLNHERLHIRWDEDASFREQGKRGYEALDEQGRAEALKKLKRYNPKNRAQLIEEWAIYNAEKAGRI